VTHEIDHLIVAADTLADGVAWCERTLGVTPGPGGRHALMGTHNRLLNLSTPACPDCYLEIIAVDPDAPPPGRPRWFGLDARPPGPPQLWHWVARAADLDQAGQALRNLGLDPGTPVAASRGDLHWRMLLRDDGAPLPGLPTLIQWDSPHPAAHMPASGLRLLSLQTAPRLTAALATPLGERRLAR